MSSLSFIGKVGHLDIHWISLFYRYNLCTDLPNERGRDNVPGMSSARRGAFCDHRVAADKAFRAVTHGQAL